MLALIFFFSNGHETKMANITRLLSIISIYQKSGHQLSKDSFMWFRCDIYATNVKMQHTEWLI